MKGLLAVLLISLTSAYPQTNPYGAGAHVVAKIREEGFQRSQVMDMAGYMADVLGARLTLSEHMKRAQVWAKGKMEKIGLVNTVIEPYMDYGVTWDNEYVSLHMLEPDYQPMVGYPIAQTPGTDGKQVLSVAIADIQSKGDMDKYKGKLKGMAVLESPPAGDRPGGAGTSDSPEDSRGAEAVGGVHIARAEAAGCAGGAPRS